MLYLVKLEDLEQRYTIKMHEEIVKYCIEENVAYNVIKGNLLQSKISVGAFLDANSTTYYKASQMGRIARKFADGKIKDGDKFLVYDMWYPGIEMIKYMAFFNRVKDIKVYGIAHAGSWTPSDFVAQMIWPFGLEKFWFQDYYDKVFVGTEHHKREIIEALQVPENRIMVTRLPFWQIPITHQAKYDTVIFASRPHKEKGFEEFIDLVWADVNNKYFYTITGGGLDMLDFADIGSDYREKLCYLLLMNRVQQKILRTKEEFYAYLGTCKYLFSWAQQENWGYSMLEGVSLGCYPLVRKGKSYDEMFANMGIKQYDSFDELKSDFLQGKIEYKYLDIFEAFNGEVYDGAKNIINEVLE